MSRTLAYALVLALGLGAFVTVGAQDSMVPESMVAFPADYADGVLYWTQDRPNGNQVRDYYTSRDAIAAASEGRAFPDGTVITVVQYSARLDADGNPVTDGDGRFIKDEVVGYTAMEKRPGWGDRIPEAIRNGDWDYNVFSAGMAPNTEANRQACFQCHSQRAAATDFVFSTANMEAAAGM